MRHAVCLGVVFSISMFLTGCACYPGGCGFGGMCTYPYTAGTVDYVDGIPGGGEADCNGCYAGDGCGCGKRSCPSGGGVSYDNGYPCSPCFECLRSVGHGIRAVGEGVLAVAAAPFVILGHAICTGYEYYPNCGCSNEVYYGDNCSQAHDYNPCCSTGYVNTASSGCTNCSGTVTEGIQPADNNDGLINNQPTSMETTKTEVHKQSTPTVKPEIRQVSHNTALGTSNNAQVRQPQRLPARQVYRRSIF